MNGKIKTEGDKNITVKDLENATVNIYPPQSNEDKKPAFVPHHITIQSLTPPSYFTGREQVLEDIADALQAHRTAALYGISGLGKSSVAYEFAKRHAEDYQYIIFIRADRLGFDANFDKTCEMMFLIFDAQDNEETKAVKFKAKIDELCANLPENKRLLLIFDNVDEIERLRKFLPQHHKSNILLTSNFHDIHDLGHRVTIDNLSEYDAMLLLYRKADESYTNNFNDVPAEEQEAIKQIARLLGFHPFALTVAGLYIRKKAKTFQQYLTRLNQSQGKILKDEKGADAYQHGTIYVAFEIPFNAISPSENIPAEEKNEVEITRECLKIASVLAADNMPEEVFRETVTLILPHQAEFISDEDNWDNIYVRLSLYGLFERNPLTATFSLHRLFRLFLEDKLKNERQAVEEPLAEILDKYFQEFDFNNKTEVERFLPHVGSFLDYLEESLKQNWQINSRDKDTLSKDHLKLSIKNELIIKLCNRYAKYYLQNGKYTIAEKYYIYFKNICERIKDIEQDWLATSYNNLAWLYYLQGRYKEAESFYINAKEISEKVLGENHPETAAIYNNLAWLYKSQGKYEETETFFIKAKVIVEKVLGKNHPLTASSYNNLAQFYRKQGRYKEAKSLFVKAKAIREKKLGKSHPDTATTYNDLALLYVDQGKYSEAEFLYVKAKDAYKKELGENHPWTAQSYTNLGAFYYQRGKSQIGLELCEKALEIFRNTLPVGHPSTQNCKDWIEAIKNSMSKE
jgi:tetratricopeptide (TPR) repeat protein